MPYETGTRRLFRLEKLVAIIQPVFLHVLTDGVDNHRFVKISRHDGQRTRANIGAGEQRDVIVVLHVISFAH